MRSSKAMKFGRLALELTLISFLILVPLAWSKEVKVELKISGMLCELCAKGIETQLAKLPGVKAATVSYETATAIVVYDDTRVSLRKLKKTIEKSGFKAEVKSKPSERATSRQAPR